MSGSSCASTAFFTWQGVHQGFFPPREPDLVTGTLDDWVHYREKLANLPQNDENVRLAISVAEARIAKLIRDARTRPWDR